MEPSSRTRQTFAIAGLWAACLAAFWTLQDDQPVRLLLPLTGAIWMAGPLLMTRFPTRQLMVASAVSLGIAVVVLLVLEWAAFTVLAFLISTLYREVSISVSTLLTDGLTVIPGALAGAWIGLAVRGRGQSTPGRSH